MRDYTWCKVERAYGTGSWTALWMLAILAVLAVMSVVLLWLVPQHAAIVLVVGAFIACCVVALSAARIVFQRRSEQRSMRAFAERVAALGATAETGEV